MSPYEKMLEGLLYDASDKKLTAMRKKARALSYTYNHTKPHNLKKRGNLLKKMLGSLGEHVKIHPPFYVDYGVHVTLGNHVYMNYGCVFLDVNQITIGHHVMLGPNVSIYTAGHPIDQKIRDEGLEYGYSVTIKDHCWIGGATIINPGVTIGEGSIIGSGSVVTKDIPPYVVAAGNPCKVIREITVSDTKFWEKEKLKAK